MQEETDADIEMDFMNGFHAPHLEVMNRLFCALNCSTARLVSQQQSFSQIFCGFW